MMQTTQIKLVIGLGNPGDEYINTRHNAGFMVVERFLEQMPSGRFTAAHLAESKVLSGKFRGRNLTLQMPLTYMNSSGLAVNNLCGKLRITPEEILVIVDDLDLPVGRLRLRNGGSDGGHNGLKSIIKELGTANFKRLRIGIGRPEPGKTIDYVLTGFEGNEADLFQKALNEAVEAVKTVLTSGMSMAMNKFNTRTLEVVETEK